jgi:hypothetical protein
VVSRDVGRPPEHTGGDDGDETARTNDRKRPTVQELDTSDHDTSDHDTSDHDTSDHDTSDEEPPAGRHRSRPAPLRQVVLRMGAGVGALLVVAALAVLTASWAGLTDAPPSATKRVHPPTPAVLPAGPTFGRTVDLEATRADRAAQRSATEAPETVAESASPVAAEAPAPAPVPVVQPGDPCSVEGARGMTSAGKPVTCAARGGNDETRWRPA